MAKIAATAQAAVFAPILHEPGGPANHRTIETGAWHKDLYNVTLAIR